MCACGTWLWVFFPYKKIGQGEKEQPKISKNTWFRGGKLGVDTNPFLVVLRGVLFLYLFGFVVPQNVPFRSDHQARVCQCLQVLCALY